MANVGSKAEREQAERRWLAEGADGLRSKGQPGYPPLLDEQQRADLVVVLKAGPKASGFDGGWTLARVATVIRRGFTVQKPARRAVERDEQAITNWRTNTWSQVVEPPAPLGRGPAAPTSPTSA